MRFVVQCHRSGNLGIVRSPDTRVGTEAVIKVTALGAYLVMILSVSPSKQREQPPATMPDVFFMIGLPPSIKDEVTEGIDECQ